GPRRPPVGDDAPGPGVVGAGSAAQCSRLPPRPGPSGGAVAAGGAGHRGHGRTGRPGTRPAAALPGGPGGRRPLPADAPVRSDGAAQGDGPSGGPVPVAVRPGARAVRRPAGTAAQLPALSALAVEAVLPSAGLAAARPDPGSG